MRARKKAPARGLKQAQKPAAGACCGLSGIRLARSASARIVAERKQNSPPITKNSLRPGPNQHYLFCSRYLTLAGEMTVLIPTPRMEGATETWSGMASLRQKSVCVIVCGMHRTGTSAVARVVNLMGANIAKDLVAPESDNVRGYWEPSAVVRIHNQMLHELGTLSSDPMPLPARWLDSKPARQAKFRLLNFITSEFGDSPLFVVKDPRISRILPLWLELLDEMGIGAVVVIPFRNPLEVADSLKQRDRMPLAKSLLLYLYSYLETELASRHRRRCFVRYDQLLADWRPLQNRLGIALDRRLSPVGGQQAEEIGQFLTDELYHHRHDQDELFGRSDVPDAVADLFGLLNQATDGDRSALLWKSFDELREPAVAAAGLLREFVLSERERIRDIENSMSWRMTAPLRWVKHTLR